MIAAVCILAAGQSSRFQSSTSKVLHLVGGRPILGWVLEAARALKSDSMYIVTRPDMPDSQAADSLTVKCGSSVAAYAADDCQRVVQPASDGTGGALKIVKAQAANIKGTTVVMYGDTPFLQAQTLRNLCAKIDQGWDIALTGFYPDNPKGYGRLIADGSGLITRIIEQTHLPKISDTDPQHNRYRLCNGGVMAFSQRVQTLLDELPLHKAKNEYYLTDLVELANKKGYKCGAVVIDPKEVMGVNTRSDLAVAEQAFQSMKRQEILNKGVSLLDPQTTYFSYDTQIGVDTIVEPQVMFGPGVTVGPACHVRGYSHLEGVTMAKNCVVGPFARLRPGTELATDVKVGNFVEVKKSQIGEGSKINHLSYVGDTIMGEQVNVGAGTITCNYDGKNKHQTVIEKGAFIGSNTSLIAPVTVGADSLVAAGSVITKPVPKKTLAVARAPQNHKNKR
jgi:bifunctional UDP-N-acetylglucosamine pyrophosphorylase/glucosamine-1-phosphate N-acetyltransferase